jgi:tRNA (guanine-N7-)-methyltransferase
MQEGKPAGGDNDEDEEGPIAPRPQGGSGAGVRASVSIDNTRTRPIRSYALRGAHVTEAQRRAYEELVPAYRVPFAPRPIDFAAVFGRSAPVVLEIGSGMGETTAAIAAAQPELDFLAVEVFAAGVGALAQRIHAQQLTNLRFLEHDAFEVVRDALPAACLAGIHVFFPDPWPKARHKKRRLLVPAFVHELALRLQDGATLHCATDWEDYALQMQEVLEGEPLLHNLHADFAPTPANPLCERPTTKFNARGTRLGHGTWDLVFQRG